MKKFGGTGGFTLIEIVIVLAIIAVLAGILTPTLTRYVGDARTRKAEADTRNLGAAIGKFYGDTGNWPIWASSSDMTADGNKFYVLKTEEGEAPDLGGLSGWDDASVDSFDDQLISNDPAYSTSGRRAWKGPYLGHESVTADPWGSLYYANVRYLWPADVGGTKPVVVISAGPNKLIETLYTQTGPSLAVGGDDITFSIK